MNYAIWAAVSTLGQAKDDKASLPEQERKCREVGRGKGWTESVQPFIVPGESRTRWVNLRDAEEQIPQLRVMLETAKSRRFDVLMMYDFNRLRDLLTPVSKTLASYGAQLYSISQPVEPLEPELFNPYASDTSSMMQGMSEIISRWQIADLRRKWRYGVTGRVQKGLPATQIPFGYNKPTGRTESKTVPTIDPLTSEIVIECKELFLTGNSGYEIARIFDQKGYPTPQGGKKWYRSTIEKMLMNPFYAGKVFLGRYKTINDPRGGTEKRIVNPTPFVNDGLHQPLYSWEDYQAILTEFERRTHIPTAARHTWSGMLSCSVCGARLYHSHGWWRCQYPGTDHIGLRKAEADYLLPRDLQRAFKIAISQPDKTRNTSRGGDEAAAFAELERRRKRVQEAYEGGVYSLPEAELKIKDIESQIAALKDKETQRLKTEAYHRQFKSSLEVIATVVDFLPTWIEKVEPRESNNLLLRVVREITVSPRRETVVYMRDT